MRFFIVVIILISACTSKQNTNEANSIPVIHKAETPSNVFPEKEIISDTNIENNSGRKISVLYNSVENFLPRTDTVRHGYQTECMGCLPVYPYQDHLVFGKQLEIFTDKTIHSGNKLVVEDKVRSLDVQSDYGERKTNKFKFSQGKGIIRYIEQDCNDADLNEIVLFYKNGEIKIKNILNVQFFEYDLDQNGIPEQFIMATRNCSQELAILRIY